MCSSNKGLLKYLLSVSIFNAILIQIYADDEHEHIMKYLHLESGGCNKMNFVIV